MILLRILREETELPRYIRRRFHLIDEEVQKLIRGVYTPYKICREYTSGTQLTTVISHAVIENLYFHTFYDIDDESKEWEEIAQSIWDYIHEKYGKEIDKYYHINCV